MRNDDGIKNSVEVRKYEFVGVGQPPPPARDLATVLLRLSHIAALKAIQAFIHYRDAASLPVSGRLMGTVRRRGYGFRFVSVDAESRHEKMRNKKPLTYGRGGTRKRDGEGK